MSFDVHLELGNDVMRTEDEVAWILRTIANDLNERGFDVGKVRLRDLNGNTVGWWEWTSEP